MFARSAAEHQKSKQRIEVEIFVRSSGHVALRKIRLLFFIVDCREYRPDSHHQQPLFEATRTHL